MKKTICIITTLLKTTSCATWELVYENNQSYLKDTENERKVPLNKIGSIESQEYIDIKINNQNIKFYIKSQQFLVENVQVPKCYYPICGPDYLPIIKNKKLLWANLANNMTVQWHLNQQCYVSAALIQKGANKFITILKFKNTKEPFFILNDTQHLYTNDTINQTYKGISLLQDNTQGSLSLNTHYPFLARIYDEKDLYKPTLYFYNFEKSELSKYNGSLSDIKINNISYNVDSITCTIQKNAL